MAPQNVRSVQVDHDSRPLSEPVTVLISPAGNEYDADTWSDANNLLASGYSVKDGHPTGPEMELDPDLDPAPGNEPDEGYNPPRAAAPAAATQPRPTPAPSATTS